MTYIYNPSKVVAKYLSPKNEWIFSLMKNSSNDESHEDVSCDVESLFKHIPVQEAIDHILQRIHVRKKVNLFVKKWIIKKLLLKLTKECVFSVNDRFIKQIDGCPMDGPISVVFSDIYVSKMEGDIAATLKPHFYKRYVDDTYLWRKENELDILFKKLNSYYPKIK